MKSRVNEASACHAGPRGFPYFLAIIHLKHQKKILISIHPHSVAQIYILYIELPTKIASMGFNDDNSPWNRWLLSLQKVLVNRNFPKKFNYSKAENLANIETRKIPHFECSIIKNLILCIFKISKVQKIKNFKPIMFKALNIWSSKISRF